MAVTLNRKFILVPLLVASALWSCLPGAAGTWSKGADMPTARSELAAAGAGKYIYVAGGLSASGVTDAFEAYDTENNLWKQLKSLPQPLHHFALANLKGDIYAAGGYVSMNFSDKAKQVRRYRPSADRWENVADLPSARAAHAMVQADGKLFVIGGVGFNPREIFEYDPEGNVWKIIIPPLPTPREHLAAVALDGKLYVLGGRDLNRKNLTVVEIYDPNGKKWSQGEAMPTPRSGFTAAVIDGLIHVTGGESLETGRTLSSHDVYDPSADTWVSRAPMPTSRHGLVSAADKSRWFLIGGATGAGSATFSSLTEKVEIFSP